MCNRLTNLIDEEDYFILWMLFEIEREVFLQFAGIVCVDTFLRYLLSILKIFLTHDGYHRLTEHTHRVHHIAAQVSPLLATILFLHFLQKLLILVVEQKMILHQANPVVHQS